MLKKHFVKIFTLLPLNPQSNKNNLNQTVMYKCNSQFTASTGAVYSPGTTITSEEYDQLNDQEKENFLPVGEDDKASDAPAAETASEVKDESTSEGEATAESEA